MVIKAISISERSKRIGLKRSHHEVKMLLANLDLKKIERPYEKIMMIPF